MENILIVGSQGYIGTVLCAEYNKKFSNIDSIKILKESENSKSNYWLNSIILKKPSIKNRDKIIKLAK